MAIDREEKKLFGLAQPDCVHCGRVYLVKTPDPTTPDNYFGFIKTEAGVNVYFHCSGVIGDVKPKRGDICHFFILRAVGVRNNDRAIEVELISQRRP